jgi:lysozyme
MTREQAQALLDYELRHTYLLGALRHCPGLITDTRRLNAIVDFCYNLGVGKLQTSTLKKKINEQNWDEAKVELLKWCKAGGKVLPGLLKRRQAEADLL